MHPRNPESVFKKLHIWYNVDEIDLSKCSSLAICNLLRRMFILPSLETSTGATLYFDDIGEGFPVILLHGWLGTGQSQLSSLISWFGQQRYRVIAPTRRGYGESLPKPRDYPYQFYHRDAHDILDLLSKLGIVYCHLIGYSDGGETALVMGGLEPKRFASIAVWGAVGSFDSSLRSHIQKNYPATWVTDELRTLNHLVSQADADRLVLGWIVAVRNIIDAGGDISLGLASNIQCPILMMIGENDVLNPEYLARKYANVATQTQLRIFRCGHAIHEEKWEEFIQVLHSFIQNVVNLRP